MPASLAPLRAGYFHDLFKSQLFDAVELAVPQTGLRKAGDALHIPARAVFPIVGAATNTDWLKDCVRQGDKGFVRAGSVKRVA